MNFEKEFLDSLLGGQWGFKNSRIPHFSRLSWLLGTTKWAEVELSHFTELGITWPSTPPLLNLLDCDRPKLLLRKSMTHFGSTLCRSLIRALATVLLSDASSEPSG